MWEDKSMVLFRIYYILTLKRLGVILDQGGNTIRPLTTVNISTKDTTWKLYMLFF